MKNLCIIPARGGSKRIPRKNIKDFLGKPIIAYSIEAALKSGLFDEVIVSTDDDDIAEIAKKYGASVPFMRSAKNSDDFATTYDVIEEVINSYLTLNKTFIKVCCIYPCAPFVTADKLKIGFDILIENNFDSVIPVVAFSFPIQRSLKLFNSKLNFVYSEHEKTRSQDLEKTYHDAGQFYWCDLNQLLETKRILNSNTGMMELTELDVQDIDNETDWKLAELKYRMISESRN